MSWFPDDHQAWQHKMKEEEGLLISILEKMKNKKMNKRATEGTSLLSLKSMDGSTSTLKRWFYLPDVLVHQLCHPTKKSTTGPLKTLKKK